MAPINLIQLVGDAINFLIKEMVPIIVIEAKIVPVIMLALKKPNEVNFLMLLLELRTVAICVEDILRSIISTNTRGEKCNFVATDVGKDFAKRNGVEIKKHKLIFLFTELIS